MKNKKIWRKDEIKRKKKQCNGGRRETWGNKKNPKKTETEAGKVKVNGNRKGE